MAAGLMALNSFMAESRSYYNSASNQFGGLFPHPGMTMAGRYKAIVDDCLIEQNATMATAMTLDTMLVKGTSYRYLLRFANLNNKQGKTVSVKNPMTGDKTGLTSTKWGLVFNYDEMGDYYAIILNCENSTPFDDVTDQREMNVALIRQCGGETTIIDQTRLSKGVSLEDDMNTLCVDVDENTVVVSIGKDELQPVLEASAPRSVGVVQVGYLVGPGARVATERALLSIENEKQVAATTLWTFTALNEYLAQSTDPIEGYWKYLDRDMQDEWLRLGGRYTLAVVRADDGYDLIYLDGAQVKKSLWKEGMIKGHLVKTMFVGNYDATWIDATLEPIDKDVQATIENGIILTISFPVYKSQVRFAKIINIDD